MKKVTGLVLTVLILSTSLAFAKNVYVKGSTSITKSGNIIFRQPSMRSGPNKTVTDNYSFKGNFNPYTGKTGTNYNRNSPSSSYFGTSGKSYKRR